METLRVLSTGEKMFVGSGLLLAVASLFPWFSISDSFETIYLRPWDLGVLGAIPVLFGLASACQILAMRVGHMTLPSLNLPWRRIQLWGAGISDAILGIMVTTVFDAPNTSIELGYWVALPAGLLLFYGAWVLQDEEL
jgi:hypothetical protein